MPNGLPDVWNGGTFALDAPHGGLAMDAVTGNALQQVVNHGRRLREVWHFDWEEPAQQSCARLLLNLAGKSVPPLAAVVGGASSGKSTVFNNLLGGHLASRITARGHATLGPILAIHENHRSALERLMEGGSLLPEYRRTVIAVDDNAIGDAHTLSVLYHDVDGIRDILLFDMPDFTSDAARREGDVTLSLLPWFDMLLVVVDHERWFDRQSISLLGAESARLGQKRMVLFNRTVEGALREEDRAALARQAERLGAECMSVLEFRRGRGFCRFAPGALDEVAIFLRTPIPERSPQLLRLISRAANQTLNQNVERASRLQELGAALRAGMDRLAPGPFECMTSLMTAAERKHLDVVSRVLRVHETAQWLSAQTRRLQQALLRVPILGTVVDAAGLMGGENVETATDRAGIARAYYEAVTGRQVVEAHRIARASRFWEEVRRWTGLEPTPRTFAWSAALRDQIGRAGNHFDEAMKLWTAKVEQECRGIGPNLRGALGVGAVGLAVILIAAPGPLSALTLVAAKGAIATALSHLAAASGAGALLGKHLERLAAVATERLLGSSEYDAVQSAAAAFRGQLVSAARQQVEETLADASALLMAHEEPLKVALESLRRAGDGAA